MNKSEQTVPVSVKELLDLKESESLTQEFFIKSPKNVGEDANASMHNENLK